MTPSIVHPARAARVIWAGIAGCEHVFANAPEDQQFGTGTMAPETVPAGVVRPNPNDLCKGCGVSRERAALVQSHLRHLGRTVPWGGPR